MAEIWDAYDKDFHQLEGITLVRGEAIPEGIYHLVSDVIVRHTDGTYLLMRRDLHKTHGGKWELSAGGSALKGENPLQAALRELKEETGITPVSLKKAGMAVTDVHHCIHVIFLAETDCDKNGIVLQQGETIDFRWESRDVVLAMDEERLVPRRAVELIRQT